MPNYVIGTKASETIDWSDGTTNGYDIIYADDGHDRIWAYGGDDIIYAGNGDDIVYGGSGNDRMHGGQGADHLDGQSGNDTVAYTESSEGVIVDLRLGKGHGGDAEGDTYASVENVLGSEYGDILVGDGQSNKLYGLRGDDYLMGEGGDDELSGDVGNDKLFGGAGADKLNGGIGSDTAYYTSSSTGVFVSLMHDIAQGGDAQGDTLYSIENLGGSSYDDQLWGDIHANVLEGFGGNDTLKGFGGEDTIKGGSGNDVLHGGAGDDTLLGGSGNDTLYGGEGYHDTLDGGFGADSFVWSSANETGWSASTADVVIDFNHAHGDLLDLSNIDADLSAAGNQAFTFIGNAAFSGAPGEVRYYYADGNTYVEMQTGTSPDADAVICLEGIQSPDAGWFVL